MVTSSRPLLLLITLSTKRDRVQIKLTFLRLFGNFLSKYLVFKSTSCMQWLLKFQCTFFALSFHKNISYLILYLWTKFQCHAFFPFQDIKHNVLLSSCHKPLRFTFDQALKQWLARRKRGEDRNRKSLNILRIK